MSGKAMSALQPWHAADEAASYTTIPLPWIREDGSRCDCYLLTVPLSADRDERRVFVYAEPGRLGRDVVGSWLARIYDWWSNPSLDLPWGMVIDLDATAKGGVIAGVVKGCAFVVLDTRMTDDPRRYALLQLSGGAFLGGLHPTRRRLLWPALRERAQRHGRRVREEELALRESSALLALAETRASLPRRALERLRRAFLRLFADDLRDDLPPRESRLTLHDDVDTEVVTPLGPDRVELAATLQTALRRADLTPREQQACDALRAGKSLAEWAEEEGIGDATARGYWHEARRKLLPHLDLR